MLIINFKLFSRVLRAGVNDGRFGVGDFEDGGFGVFLFFHGDSSPFIPIIHKNASNFNIPTPPNCGGGIEAE